MTTVSVFAPAKINLTLHITGRRDDGYHLIDSLVAFAPFGDELVLSPAPQTTLAIDGPEAGDLPCGPENLARRAADIVSGGAGFAVSLTKHLPVASGIGGGSADAAAAARGCLAILQQQAMGHWPDDMPTPDAPANAALLALGADIPMCMASAPLRARGIGEVLEPVILPPIPAVLVNPRVALSTATVFARLKSRDNPPMTHILPDWEGTAELISWLACQRNDLETPACALAPVIADVLGMLRDTDDCRLARMSGSGATCFGLYPSEGRAKAAAEAIGRAHPDWWVANGTLGDMSGAARPRQADAGREAEARSPHAIRATT